MDERDYKAMNEHYTEMVRYEEDVSRVNNRIFSVIEKYIGAGFVRDLSRYIEELNCCEPFYFKDEPIGKFQEENESGCITGVWIEQWSTGMEGDSYSGNISIKLKDYKWLIIPYSC